MQISDKISLLHQISNSCERCLIAPENPFTLDNPDLIAANSNKLFAVYLPSFNEQKNMDHLLRRLYLSKLCFGYNMFAVLLILNDMSQIEANSFRVLNYAFSHISNSVDDVVSYIKTASPESKRFKYFSEIQTNQYINYRISMELSAKAYADAHNKTNIHSERGFISYESPVITRSWYYDIMKESKNYWRSKGCLVGEVMKNQKTSFKSLMDNIMTTAVMTLFNLDNGNIYPTQYYNELSLINTNWKVFDENLLPNKYHRMLSFIGLTPARITSKQDMEWLYDNYLIIRQNVIS